MRAERVIDGALSVVLGWGWLWLTCKCNVNVNMTDSGNGALTIPDRQDLKPRGNPPVSPPQTTCNS